MLGACWSGLKKGEIREGRRGLGSVFPTESAMRLLQAMILLIPWVFNPTAANPYLEQKELALTVGMFAIVLWAVFAMPLPYSEPTNPYLLWLALYLAALGFLTFHWRYISRTLEQQQVVYNVHAWLPTVSTLMALMAVRLLSMQYFRTFAAVQVTTQWWCLSSALSAGYAVLQSLGLDQWYTQPGINRETWVWQHITGSFGNPEYLALYLAMLLPLFLMFQAKKYLVWFALCVAVITLTQVRGAWLIAAVSLCAYAAARVRRRFPLFLLIGSVILIPAGFFLIRNLALLDERIEIWKAAWNLLTNVGPDGVPRIVQSWTGRGLGSVSLLWRNTPWAWVHNEWLQAMVELGVLGAGLLLAAVTHVTIRAWRRASESELDSGWFAVWIAFLTASVIFPVAHWAHTAWVGICAWAILERKESYAEA